MKMPDGFLDGAQAVLSGRGRAGMALAVVLASASAMPLSTQASQEAHARAAPATTGVDGYAHFSLVASSPEGNRVRMTGQGSHEAVSRLQLAMEDYAQNGNVLRLREEAILDNASMNITPHAQFTMHDSRSDAISAITAIALTTSVRFR